MKVKKEADERDRVFDSMALAAERRLVQEKLAAAAGRSKDINIRYDAPSSPRQKLLARSQKEDEIRRLGFVPNTSVLRDRNGRDGPGPTSNYILEPRFDFMSLAPG